MSKNFKQVNIAVDDWHLYNERAIQMSALRGKRISIPALIKESMDNYYSPKAKSLVDNVDKAAYTAK